MKSVLYGATQATRMAVTIRNDFLCFEELPLQGLLTNIQLDVGPHVHPHWINLLLDAYSCDGSTHDGKNHGDYDEREDCGQCILLSS